MNDTSGTNDQALNLDEPFWSPRRLWNAFRWWWWFTCRCSDTEYVPLRALLRNYRRSYHARSSY